MHRSRAKKRGEWAAPFGGRGGRLTTNPISHALPVQGEPIRFAEAATLGNTGCGPRIFKDAANWRACPARKSHPLPNRKASASVFTLGMTA